MSVMFRIIRLLFVLFFIPLSLFAADLNSALYENKDSVKLYEQLLSKIDRQNNSPNVQLEKTLLYKLINLTKYPPKPAFSDLSNRTVATQKEYMSLFKQLVNYSIKSVTIQNEIKDKNDKLDFLKNTVEQSSENNPELLLYQLQYAFYYKTLKNLQAELEYFNTNFEKWEKYLALQLSRVKFNTTEANSKIKDLKSRYESIKLDIEKQKIEKERLLLVSSKQDNLNRASRNIQIYERQKDEIIGNIIDNYLILFFSALKHKDKKAFEYKKMVNRWEQNFSSDKKIESSSLENIMQYILQNRFGRAKVFFNDTRHHFIYIMNYAWSVLHKPLFSISGKPVDIISLFMALLIFILGFYIGKLYKRYIAKLSYYVSNITPSSQTILSNMGYYVILLIGFFTALRTVGINLSSLTIIAGALSVGIGFGLQNLVSNFVSGFIMMFEKSIKIGDYIEISENLRGRVSDMRLRSTTITTNDNIDIIVPNQTFIQNNVINWTLADNIRRMRIPFGVAYGSSVDKVKQAVLQALEKSSIHYVRNRKVMEPQVVMTNMNSSSVDFELYVWVEGEKTLKPRRTTSEFLILIYNALYENNIEIPFPQMDLHIKDIKDTLKVTEKKNL